MSHIIEIWEGFLGFSPERPGLLEMASVIILWIIMAAIVGCWTKKEEKISLYCAFGMIIILFILFTCLGLVGQE